jgi:hypothetical protein
MFLERIHRDSRRRDHALALAAVHADQLSQEVGRQHRRPARFLIDDDLGQDLVGDILARFRVHHLEIAAFADHRRQFVERDVARAMGIVESPVGIFLIVTLSDADFAIALLPRCFGKPRLCHAASQHAPYGQGRSAVAPGERAARKRQRHP